MEQRFQENESLASTASIRTSSRKEQVSCVQDGQCSYKKSESGLNTDSDLARELWIEKRLAEIENNSINKATYIIRKTLRTTVKGSKHKKGVALSSIDLTNLGKIEFSLKEGIKALGKEAWNNKNLIRRLKNTVKGIVNNKIGSDIMEWRDRGKNLVLYVRNKDIEDRILTEDTYMFAKECLVRIKPLIEEGDFDFRHYRIKLRLNHHLPTEAAISYLEKKWKIQEVITEGHATGNDGELIAIVRLNSKDELESLGKEIEILGYRCLISHPLLYSCLNCGMKGHWEKRCEKIQKAKADAKGLRMEISDLLKTEKLKKPKCQLLKADSPNLSYDFNLYEKGVEYTKKMKGGLDGSKETRTLLTTSSNERKRID